MSMITLDRYTIQNTKSQLPDSVGEGESLEKGHDMVF